MNFFAPILKPTILKTLVSNQFSSSIQNSPMNCLAMIFSLWKKVTILENFKRGWSQVTLTILAESFDISSPHKLGAQASLCTKTSHRSFCKVWNTQMYVSIGLLHDKNNEIGAQTSFLAILM